MENFSHMPKMEDAFASIKKVMGYGLAGLTLITVLLTASIAANIGLVFKLMASASKQPIYVIPGAAEGVYSPGLAEYNMKNAVRYLLSLGTNLSVKNAKERLSEIEKYCSPQFLPIFRLERDKRLKEIAAQDQSRSAQLDKNDVLTLGDDKVYTYIATGPLMIYSGSLPMSHEPYRYVIRFTVGNASEENKYGIEIQAFDVIPVATPVQRRTSPDAGAV